LGPADPAINSYLYTTTLGTRKGKNKQAGRSRSEMSRREGEREGAVLIRPGNATLTPLRVKNAGFKNKM